MLIDLLPMIAAIASAIAAIAAAFATWRAPRSAARLAESLRLENEKHNEIRRQKLFVFSELLKSRGIQVTREAAAAFNLIDLVFCESQEVRDAWAELYSAYGREGMPSAVIDDKLRRLLREMARDIGLSESLRPADLERYYYPTGLAKEDQARSLQIQQVLAAQSGSPETMPLFPPKPEMLEDYRSDEMDGENVT